MPLFHITWLRSNQTGCVLSRDDMPINPGDLIVTSATLASGTTDLKASNLNIAIVGAEISSAPRNPAGYIWAASTQGLRETLVERQKAALLASARNDARICLEAMLAAEDKTERFRALAARSPEAAELLAFAEGLTDEVPAGLYEPIVDAKGLKQRSRDQLADRIESAED